MWGSVCRMETQKAALFRSQRGVSFYGSPALGSEGGIQDCTAQGRSCDSPIRGGKLARTMDA